MEIFDNILLKSITAEKEPWRITRLHRIIGYFFATSVYLGRPEAIKKIDELHDNRGELVIYWNEMPNYEEEKLLTEAWRSDIGGGLGAGQITHLKPDDDPILENKNDTVSVVVQ